MSFTADFDTTLGQTRALIGDVNSETPMFQDEQLQVFLDLNSDIPQLAAVAALYTQAGAYARMSKVKLMDVEIDGSTAAKDLRLLAKQIKDDYVAGDELPDFDIAEMQVTPFARREVRLNDWLQSNPED